MNSNDFGDMMQEVLINFLEKHFGYRFAAGDRNRETLNADMIEEYSRCEYIAPVEDVHGPLLKFTDHDGKIIRAAMPDILFYKNPQGEFRWGESKGFNYPLNLIKINRQNFNGYVSVAKKTKFTTLVFLVMPQEDGLYNIHYQDVLVLNKISGDRNIVKFSGKPAIEFHIKDFETLNQYPFKIEKYI